MLDEVISNDPASEFGNTVGNNSIPSANAVALTRMRERVEALEELNDHLCYYLNFLIENLPELITRTLQSATDLVPNGKIVDKFHLNDSIENKDALPNPTRREHDVLELLERGLCAKEIATRLYISETTVITHKKNLKKKFNVKNTAELISKIKSGT